MPFDGTYQQPERPRRIVQAERLEKLANMIEHSSTYDPSANNHMLSWATCMAGYAARSGQFEEFKLHRTSEGVFPVYGNITSWAAVMAYFGTMEPFDATRPTKEAHVAALRLHANKLRRGMPAAPAPIMQTMPPTRETLLRRVMSMFVPA